MSIAIGQTLGRYRIEEELGAGGMGVVYRAHDEKLERDLAIKVLAPGTLDDEAARKRFRNEAKVLSKLNHPAIQTIYDFDTIEGHDLLISELVPGISLDARLHGGPLPEKEVVRLALQFAQGLAAAHEAGVLHRDLKPANLRVTPDGRLKILDFGLATLSRNAVLTMSKATESLEQSPSGISGTLPYMPPEQLLGEAADERSDIYSAGVALFEMATGRMPFRETLVPKLTNAILHDAPPAPTSIMPKLSPELGRILLKCLEKDPELRYQSAKELAADLRRMEALSTRADTAARIPIAKPRRRWPYALAGVALLVVLAAVLAPRLAERWGGGDTLQAVRWEQLTFFNDAAEIPAVSLDGKMVAFLRGTGNYGGTANDGQIWVKPLPEGDPIQLTRTIFRKQTLAFSPDGARVYFTQIQGNFGWNTFEVPVFGGQEPKLFLANATGLNWIDKDRLLYSTITENIHMVLATSNASRTDERFVHKPEDPVLGMVHRSALSPDRKWVLFAEMNGEWFGRCKVAPFDSSAPAREVGPPGTCTWAQWTPDGKWMYFTVDTGNNGFHVWRQRFPDGEPQQVTPNGASEEEGLAMMPDGKSFITTAGTQQSSVWLHDSQGDHQINSEGFAFQPTISPDGKKLYYMRRVPGAKSYFSGELWVSDVSGSGAQRLFPGLILTHYSISRDEKKIVFATEQGQANSGIWIADLDGTRPPRQLTRGGEYRVFFGPPGQILYQAVNEERKLMRMNEDGSDKAPASDQAIMQLQSVSPDGRWAIVGVTPPDSHGDRNAIALALPTAGGKPLVISDNGSYGFGAIRMGAPLISWSWDGKWMYVGFRYLGFGSKKTAIVPVQPGSPPPTWINNIRADSDIRNIPGARLVPEDNVYAGRSGGEYVVARKSAKANLFRIYFAP